MDIVFEYILGGSDDMGDEYLLSNSKLSLSNFVSLAKSVTKSMK